MSREDEAKAVHKAGMLKVATEPEPVGQKFPCQSRVRIADDLGDTMSHFRSGCDATVLYTYAHAFGSDDVTSYCLDLDGDGRVSWYREWQLTAIPFRLKITQNLCVESSDCLVVGSVHEQIPAPEGRDDEETWVKGDCGCPVRLLPCEWEYEHEVDDE